MDERISRRRQAAQRYNCLLAGLELTTPYEAPEAKHVYRAYAVLVDERDRVREHLWCKGIETKTYYVPPLHLQPAYARLGFGSGDFPVAEEIAAKMLCLPIFPDITEEQIVAVAAALNECVPAKAGKRTHSRTPQQRRGIG
jgi:dTDP-4-amino-4,6-dideoxygalactose transaminase